MVPALLRHVYGVGTISRRPGNRESPARVVRYMGALLEFRVMLVGAKNAPQCPISILAQTPTIALYRGAIIAMDCDARDFDVVPGGRFNHER